MLQNTPHFVLALLGAWKAGATVVPVNPMYKSGEVGHVLHGRRGDRPDLLRPRLGRPICARRPPDSPVRIVLTACELDLQTRDDARVLGFERLPQAADADDLVAVARARAPAPADRELRPPTSR